MNKSIKAFKIGISGIIVALMIFCSFMLTGCDPASFYFSPEDLSDIVSVELINYNNPNQKEFWSWVPDHESDLKPFDNSKFSVLETLDEDKIPDLTNALCECFILYKYYVYDSPKGMCLKLTYSNGNFLIVSGTRGSSGYIGEFSSDGEVAYFYGCFHHAGNFKILVNEYFETKI